MECFTRLTALAAPLPEANIDTDIIFPARFLLITAKAGLGRYAFYEWRYDAQGAEIPSFVLNNPVFKGAKILVCGDNFGCGSSREQAPWALRDLGVRCVISTSFGEIFYANCFRNGILPVVVETGRLTALTDEARACRTIVVDLTTQAVVCQSGEPIAFTVEPWRRDALLNGWDEIGMILGQDGEMITEFEKVQRASKPWLYLGE